MNELGHQAIGGIFQLGGIQLVLSEFCPDCYDNTLRRLQNSLGSLRCYDMLRWNEYRVEIWRQKEGSFHNRRILGPFKFSWEEVGDRIRGEGVKSKELGIPPNELRKLLKLREIEYRAGQKKDVAKVNSVLQA